MGHSLTTFDRKHINSKDYKIETWLYLICQEIENLPNAPDWIVEARLFWFDHAKNYVNGCMDPQFDKYLINKKRLGLFIDICQKIYDRLLLFGETIPKEFLNDLCGYEPPILITEDNSADLYLTFGKSLLRLLKGRQFNEIVNA